jgi:hypothetical protein
MVYLKGGVDDIPNDVLEKFWEDTQRRSRLAMVRSLLRSPWSKC